MESRFFEISSEWETGMSLEEANEKNISAQLTIGKDVIRMYLSKHYHNGVEIYIQNQYGEDEEFVVNSLPSKSEMMVQLTHAFEATFDVEQGWEHTVPSHYIVGGFHSGLKVETESLFNSVRDLNLWVFDYTSGKYGNAVYLERDFDGTFLICWYLERDYENDGNLLELEMGLTQEILKKVESL